MLEALSNLSISTIVIIVIFIAPLLTGLRILIHHYFDIITDRKLFFKYLFFYIFLLSFVFLLLSFNFFGGGLNVQYIVVIFILLVITVEYLFFYKKHFDYEPSEKYILCITFSHISGIMLLVLIFNLLTILFTMLFE